MMKEITGTFNGSLNSYVGFGITALLSIAIIFSVGAYINDRRRNKRINKGEHKKRSKQTSFTDSVKKEIEQEEMDKLLRKRKSAINSESDRKKQRDEEREMWKMKKEQNRRQ